MSSLPVPLSPWIYTVESVDAIRETTSSTRSIALLRATMFSKPYRSARSPLSREISDVSLLFSRARSMCRTSSRASKGFVRYVAAPRFIASTALSMLPCAVRMMTGIPGLTL